jgi:hypothetical protein
VIPICKSCRHDHSHSTYCEVPVKHFWIDSNWKSPNKLTGVTKIAPCRCWHFEFMDNLEYLEYCLENKK